MLLKFEISPHRGGDDCSLSSADLDDFEMSAMNKFCHPVFSLFIALSSVVASAQQQQTIGNERSDYLTDRPSPQSSSDDYEEAIKKLREAVRYEVESKDLPAFSISLVVRDEMIWAEGFGYQDPEKKQPASAETVYRV